jgi:hypothetical protein
VSLRLMHATGVTATVVDRTTKPPALCTGTWCERAAQSIQSPRHLAHLYKALCTHHSSVFQASESACCLESGSVHGAALWTALFWHGPRRLCQTYDGMIVPAAAHRTALGVHGR